MNLQAIVKLMPLLILLCSAGVAQEAEETTLPSWREYCEAEASKYKLLPPDKETKWERVQEPVFSHRNPLSREEYGLVYLWKQHDGRPVAAVTVIACRRRNATLWYDVHELHSLYDMPLRAEYAGKLTWEPRDGGLRWQVIPNATEPAKNHRLLQSQAKSIARKFTAQMTLRGEQWNLRRLDSPIYKYDLPRGADEGGQPVSGAIFAYCRATDPEALLVLEVRKDAMGDWSWHFAPAAFSFSPTEFRHEDAVVWKESLGRRVYSRQQYHHGIYRNRRIRIGEVQEEEDAPAEQELPGTGGAQKTPIE